MATYESQGNNSFRATTLTIDTQKYYEENEGFLDESLLDSSLDMSPPTTDGSRRESYTVFSPKTQAWTPVGLQHSHCHDNPIIDIQENNNFMINQQCIMPIQQQQWTMDGITLDQGSSQLNESSVDIQTVSFRPIQSQTPFSNTGSHVSLFSPSTAMHVAASLNSPQKSWTAANEFGHRTSKRIRMCSPDITLHSPTVRKGDGIRKKNARFDIPAERTLINIDRLIADSLDDQEIKELKQQKRLLRNRQAALDSRQRKKQHTERLEDEKKQFTGLIQDLERDLLNSQHNEDALRYQLQECQGSLHQMQIERENMCRQHAQETLTLHKKIDHLLESIRKLESTPMTPALSSTNFAVQDYDNLAVDGWDMFEQDPAVKSESILGSEDVVRPATRASFALPSPAQSVLLTILLLGAFVACRGNVPGIPTVSEDVQAASTTILKDASKSVIAKALTKSSSDIFLSPSNSNMLAKDNFQPWSVTQPQIATDGNLSNSLAVPVEENNQHHLFEVLSTQYGDLPPMIPFTALPDLLRKPSASMSAIAATLRTLPYNEEHDCSYSCSPLWNQVPEDLVSQFTHLVE